MILYNHKELYETWLSNLSAMMDEINFLTIILYIYNISISNIVTIHIHIYILYIVFII